MATTAAEAVLIFGEPRRMLSALNALSPPILASAPGRRHEHPNPTMAGQSLAGWDKHAA
jgi:hypothetical protein